MSKTKNTVIDQLNKKQETIQHLTDLMQTIQMAYYKGRMTQPEDGCGFGQEGDLWIHESRRDSSAISIDLYNFMGDGKDVCEGLHGCEIAYDDGSIDKGWLFCMCYDPDEEMTPLTFLFLSDDQPDDIELEPDSIPTAVLQNIIAWLEREMQPAAPKPEPKPDLEPIITKFVNFCFDYPHDFIEQIAWNCQTRHLRQKFDAIYDEFGSRAAVTTFYKYLSSDNRSRLAAYIRDVYEG